MPELADDRGGLKVEVEESPPERVVVNFAYRNVTYYGDSASEAFVYLGGPVSQLQVKFPFPVGGGVVLDLLRQGVSVKVVPDTTVVVDLGTIAIACVV